MIEFFDHLTTKHGKGANVAKLLLWANHVEATLAVLSQVKASLDDPSVASEFEGRAGWWRTKRKRNQHGTLVRVPNEDAITDAIVECFKRLREAPPPGSAIELNPMFSLQSQQRRRMQSGIGPMGLKDTDITAYLAGSIHLDFRIEAKVVFEDGDLAREYLSERGIRRFTDPVNPYTVEIVGGMVAYCVSHSGEHWSRAIRHGLGRTGCIADVAEVAGAGLRSVSDVVGADGGPPVVSVLHFCLEFRTDPSSPS